MQILSSLFKTLILLHYHLLAISLSFINSKLNDTLRLSWHGIYCRRICKTLIMPDMEPMPSQSQGFHDTQKTQKIPRPKSPSPPRTTTPSVLPITHSLSFDVAGPRASDPCSEDENRARQKRRRIFWRCVSAKSRLKEKEDCPTLLRGRKREIFV